MPGSVRVRMYQVGYGDCFLISLPGPRHVIVDCGSLAGGDALPDVVGNIAEETGHHVHVVIASNRHGEHISGFADLADRWNEIEVDEVWMPWTEDPHDAHAVQLQRRHDRVAEKLAGDASEEVALLARNSRTNQRAMDTLIDGFRGRPERCYVTAGAGEIRSPAVPGLHVKVIGPGRSEAELERHEIGCSLAELSLGALVPDDGPFDARWRLERRRAVRVLGRDLTSREAPALGTRETAKQLAFWLDRALNETSLFLLLRFGRARLLFPGDAPGHAWIPLLERTELAWELQRVNFYKVSHHGSHTGTPVRAVTAMQAPLCAVSTLAEPWPALPHRPLLRQLAESGTVVRSDRPPRRGVRRGRFWVDLELPA